MDDELRAWSALYRSQQEEARMQVVIELTRLRRRDRVRLTGEWIASVLLVGVGGAGLAFAPLPAVFPAAFVVLGLGSMAFLVRHHRRIRDETWAAPAQYAAELAARNQREQDRLRPVWGFVLVCALCVAFSAWALATAWEAYLALPWTAVVGFGGQAAILAGVWWWRGRELRRLQVEAAHIQQLQDDLAPPDPDHAT